MAQIVSYSLYILLGLLPSLIWLSFYLRKDKHPEPNSMVISIFTWGMLLAPLAVILELLLIWLLNPTTHPLAALTQIPQLQNSLIKTLLAATFIPALVEEYLKYSVVKFKVLKNPEFDEPIDAMLYCIIAGLGFAAIENLIILFKLFSVDFVQALSTMGFRFLGATLVHALASGMVGYWLARSLLNTQQRKKLILIGLTLAIVFHACYNYLVIRTLNQQTTGQELFSLSLLIILMVATVMLVSVYFQKIKKQQAVCQT